MKSSFTKAYYRQLYLRQLARVESEDRDRVSEVICKKLLFMPRVNASQHVALYAATGWEIILTLFIAQAIRQKKRLYFPRYHGFHERYDFAEVRNPQAELIRNKHNIFEPPLTARIIHESVKEKLLCLIPGLAFDQYCHRLGRGKGHYDRLLADIDGYKIGIAYDWQIHDAMLPSDSHDIPLDSILSENRCIHKKDSD